MEFKSWSALLVPKWEALALMGKLETGVRKTGVKEQVLPLILGQVTN